ncbi:MAG: DUF1614 domain-containing protein [Candidatus Thermoplasmatota archaeon]|nr:DUF1614 domain-containing protein [Candidatus Thermoplasmatota archaeon]
MKIGFSHREMGLISIGPFAAMMFDMPVFIYKNYFLAFNIGGAVVPIVLSIHLLKKKDVPLAKTIFGVAVTTVATFMITRVTDIGVVASFPFYLIPSVLAVLISFLLFSHHSEKIIGYGYAISTLGVVIGGDFFHFPEIFSKPFMGSVGGAGLYDMVYIAGLLSVCLILPFMGRSIKRAAFPLKDSAALLKKASISKDYREAMSYIIQAVELKTSEAARKFGIIGDDALRTLVSNDAYRDYILMKRKKVFSADGVKRAMVTGRLIIDALKKKEMMLYASTFDRSIAFVLDSIVLFPFSVFLAIISRMNFLLIFSIFLFSLQFLYFTVLEYFYGLTVGKAFMNITVKADSMEKMDFISSFTRNVIRFFDMFLGFYLISLILIILSPKKQRLGDIVAGSIVVKNI